MSRGSSVPLTDAEISRVYCGVYQFASETLTPDEFSAFRRGTWPSSTTAIPAIHLFGNLLFDLLGLRRPHQISSSNLRQLSKKLHIDKYRLTPAALAAIDLNVLDFKAYYQFYTLGMFLSRCGTLLTRRHETLSDGNIWAAPLFTSAFATSDNAMVPATQLEVEASLFIATHFADRESRHHLLKDINVARKQMISPYVDLVELPCYRSGLSLGLAANIMEGSFRPNRSPTPSSTSPFQLDIVDPAASPNPPAPTHARRDNNTWNSSPPSSDTPTNNTPPSESPPQDPFSVPLLTRYDSDPDADEESALDARILLQRPRASADSLLHNPFRAFDHIPLVQCIGGNDTHFSEVQTIARTLQGRWAECVQLVASHLLDVAATATSTPRVPGMSEDPIDLEMERAIKLLLLLGLLILRKPRHATSPSAITKILGDRMDLLLGKDFGPLVASYEEDIIIKKATPSRRPTEKDNDKRAVREAIALLRSGKVGKAQNILLSKGVADGTCPAVLSQLSQLHPKRKAELPPPTSAQIQYPRATIDRDVFDAELLRLQSMTAPGLGLLRNEHLTSLVFHPNRQVSPLARDAVDQLYRLLNLIANGSLPSYFFVLFYSVRQIALFKVDPNELPDGVSPPVRPIGIGSALPRLLWRCLLHPFVPQVQTITAPEQYGIGEKAGGSKLTTGARMLLAADKSLCCLSVDMKNAFNEVKRLEGLSALWSHTPLRPLWYALYRKLSCKSIIQIGGGDSVQLAPYRSEEGYVQGASESMLMTCLSTDASNKKVNEFLRMSGGMLIAGADDTYLLGPLDQVLRAYDMFSELLAGIGLTLNESKTRMYADQSIRNQSYFDALRAKNILEGRIDVGDDTSPRGLKIFGVPVGEDSFIRQVLDAKADQNLF